MKWHQQNKTLCISVIKKPVKHMLQHMVQRGAQACLCHQTLLYQCKKFEKYSSSRCSWKNTLTFSRWKGTEGSSCEREVEEVEMHSDSVLQHGALPTWLHALFVTVNLIVHKHIHSGATYSKLQLQGSENCNQSAWQGLPSGQFRVSSEQKSFSDPVDCDLDLSHHWISSCLADNTNLRPAPMTDEGRQTESK